MNRWHFFMAALLFLAALLLYTFKLGEIPSGFHGDEAELSLFSGKILRGEIPSIIGVGQHNHPTTSFLPQVGSLLLFGENMFSARFSSALFSAFSVLIFYFFLRYLFNARVALFSSILFATSHLWIAMSRLAINNVQIIFFELVAFYLLFLALEKRSLIYSLLLGGTCGLMFYLYAGFRLIPVIIGLVLLRELFVNKHRLALVEKILVSLIFFLTVSFPQLNFYLNNPSSFNARANSIFIFSNSAEATQWRESNYKQKGNIEIFFEQTKRTFMISNPRDASGQYGYPGRILDPVTTILVLLGVFIAIRYVNKAKYLLLLLWFFLTLIVGNILMVDPFFLPRATGALPVIFIFAGLSIDRLLQIFRKPLNKMGLIFYTALSFLLIVMVVINLKIYFIDSEREMFGDPNKYAATKIANYLKGEDPSYAVVFLTSPFLHANFAPIRFLSPKTKVIDIERPDQYQPTPITKTIFFIYPSYKGKLNEIKTINPNGMLTTEKDKKDQIQYFIYKVY